MRVLIVEDDNDLRGQLEQQFRGIGYAVDVAADGDEGAFMACEYPLDIALVDLGLPGKSGMAVIQALRDKGCSYPVLILTARDRWEDKVEGLEAGADDYLTKPFHIEELFARVRALLRRTGGWSQADLVCGPIVLQAATQQVLLDGQPVELTAYEYKLLEYLMLHAGEVISKSKLTEHLYDDNEDRDSNVLEVFVRRLRRKLDPEQSLDPIETLRGRGYRMRLERG